MSGTAARNGFRFQDLYLLLRVLRASSETFEEGWRNEAHNLAEQLRSSPLRFGIEASLRSENLSGEAITEPDWDVLVLAPGRLEFAEVKSGAIAKDDRLAFWNPLRHELARCGGLDPILIPVLVIDPGKAGDVRKWHDLVKAASAFDGQLAAEEPTANVCTGAPTAG